MSTIFIAPRLEGKTGGEIYNQHFVEALRKVGDIRVVESFEIRKLIGKRLTAISNRLGGKHRLIGLMMNALFLVQYGLSRRTIVVDWESVRDAIWLLRWNQVISGTNVFLIFHIDEWEQEDNRGEAVITATLRIATSVITISEYSRTQLLKLELGKRIEMLRPGMSKSESRHRKIRNTNSTKRILFVGSLIPRKGLHTLLDAVSRLKNQDFILQLVGSTTNADYVNVLRNQATQSGIVDRLNFVGRVNDVELQEFYQDADIFVFPSTMEGYGMAVAEAMQLGLPIIAANAGALPELVEHEANGLLFAPNDPEALAYSLDRLLSSKEMCSRMGVVSIERSKRMTTWDEFEVDALDTMRSLTR